MAVKKTIKNAHIAPWVIPRKMENSEEFRDINVLIATRIFPLKRDQKNYRRLSSKSTLNTNKL